MVMGSLSVLSFASTTDSLYLTHRDSLFIKTCDSLPIPFQLPGLQKLILPPNRPPAKLTYTINWDARSSLIDNKIVNIWGVNSGIRFGYKRHELTLGYYWLTFNSLLRLIDLRRDAAQRINLEFYTKTDLYFFSLMYWPNIIENRKWRFSIPIEIGIGATQSTDRRLLNDLQLWRRRDFFMPAQAGLFLKWKATRWVGLAIQGGYRYAIYQQNVPSSFNGIYYSFGFTTESAVFTDSYDWLKKQYKKHFDKQGKRKE